MALAPLKIAALQQSQPITRDQQGNPATWFMRALNDTFKNIVAAVNAVIEAQNAADAAQAAADTAQGTANGAQASATTAQTTANGAVTSAASAQTTANNALALASTAVQQDTQSAPGYSTYSGHTASVTYVQAEAQATDDAIKAASAALHALIGKLQAANVLT